MKLYFLFFMITAVVYATELRSKIDHIVVIYLENRSFDNLFHGFLGADTSDHPFEPYKVQKDENGTAYTRLPMGAVQRAQGFPLSVPNAPFLIDKYIPQNRPIPDLVHRFYQNQLQMDEGENDKFVFYSDAMAQTMGYHDSHKSALWHYAHEFTLCDHFFTGAFGGSFLNHQWLIAARAPYVGADSNLSRYVLDKGGKIIRDGILTPDGYAVNTVQPYYPPYAVKAVDSAQRLKPLIYDTIGDRLNEKGISWKWYSGGFDQAVAGDGEAVDYQFHHNPFLYFARYAPGTEGRTHLKDEKDFFDDINTDNLPSVVFFKPIAMENQHPGYASYQAADRKVRYIVETIRSHPKLWNHTVIIITYDENGGFWDHVASPVIDRWGPGIRIPTIIVSPFSKKGFIDHRVYDTTSILRMIEWRYELNKLGERNSTNLIYTLKSKVGKHN